MDDLSSLLHTLTETLLAQGKTITTAESCTGGLIAGYLTLLPGSSAWFERGFVTYSNLAKQQMLDVDEALIRLEGAVSERVAESMALGALKHSVAHVSLSVTGIAGPEGGSVAKPVGTVCFAWAVRAKEVKSLRCCYGDVGREQIRHLACQQALRGMSAILE